MNIDVDVVVIGGGPVGATALALCGRAGLTAIGLEKDSEIWPTARAVHFDGETMRTLQGLGIASRFQDVVIPMKDVEIVNEAGDVLAACPDRTGSATRRGTTTSASISPTSNTSSVRWSRTPRESSCACGSARDGGRRTSTAVSR